jgi:DNA primase
VIPAEQISTAHTTDILATARRYTTLKRTGAEYIGPCPKCGGTDRFGINVKKRVWNCRGCGKGGDAIALVMHAMGASFAEAVAELTGESRRPTAPPRQPDPAPRNQDDYAEEQHRKAAWLWSQREPIGGTIAETYLRARRIVCALPATLGFLAPRKPERIQR